MTRNEIRQAWKKKIPNASVLKHKDKICKDCKELKACRWNSCFDIHGNPEYKTRCTDCQRLWERDYSKANRTKYSANTLDRKYVRKKRCIDYLGGKCKYCGYCKSVRALTFHHLDRATKKFELSQILDYNWQTVTSELDKCELVCFNCHMEQEEIYDHNKDHRRTNQSMDRRRSR